MIKTLVLRNFKVFRDLEVGLGPLTLIVGPNASGKSTILEALGLLTDLLQSQGEVLLAHNSANPPPSWLTRARRYGSQRAAGAFRMGCSGVLSERRFSILVDLNVGLWRGFGGISSHLVLSAFSLDFDVEKLAASSYRKEIDYRLPRDGSGLSSILAGLYLEHLDIYRTIIHRLKQVVPIIKDVRLKRAKVNGVVGYELVFDTPGAESLPAHSIGAGTLIALGLLTVLSSPEPPQLVLIDGLERGFHPKVLGELIHQFRLLQEQNPELQSVATRASLR